MNRTLRIFLSSSAVSLGLAAGAAAPSHAQGISGGDVPVPAFLVSGVYRSSWDGSYSDLLAADALAACWTTQTVSAHDPVTGIELDGFIQSLINRMSVASCRVTCSNPAIQTLNDVKICAYLDSRKDATCNMDAATGQPRALNTRKFRTTSQTADYVVPSAAALGLSGTAATRAVQQAQAELSYAELSLCMAEHLSQKLDTVQVAFASGDDLQRVQQAVRERALTAVYEYSVIFKTFAGAVAPAGAINADGFFLLPFSRWANSVMTAANAFRFGDDFAQAIKLLVDATEASIKLKLRAPDAQSSFGVPTFQFGRLASMAGSRSDILDKILYDGSDHGSFVTHHSAIQTDTSDPQVGVLLALARRANALRILLSGSVVLTAPNAQTLHLAVENFLRNDDCTIKGIPPASCVLANASTPPTAFMLWTKYRITRAHAQSLTDALTEALFGPPAAGSRQTGNWGYGDPFGGGAIHAPGQSGSVTRPAERLTMHFFGTNQFTGDVNLVSPVGEIVLDPKFSIAPVDAAEIQSLRPWARLPSRDINPRGWATDQISQFRFFSLNVFDVTGYPQGRRALGSNTVLALAREALMQLSIGPTTPRGIYSQGSSAVTLIEKMIGPRQATVRMQFNTVGDAACVGCVRFTPRQTVPGTFDIAVDMMTKSTDPYTSIAIAPGIPLASTLARSSTTRTIFGSTQATALAPLTYQTPAATTLTAGYVQRTATGAYNPNAKFGVTVMLKSSGPPAAYRHVWTGAMAQSGLAGAGPPGTVVSFGGRFDREVSDAWSFDPQRWSVPKYDGFGMRRTWTPFADASLFGNAPGVSVERHFVAQAEATAGQSSQALQQAFDTLQQEALDDAAVAASDVRATGLTNLEYQSLCGGIAPNCVPTYAFRAPVVPACPGGMTADCEAYRGVLGTIIGNVPTLPAPPGIPIATAVNNEINAGNPAPTFPMHKGGTLQGLLIAQWNAWQGLNAGMTAALGTAQSAIAQRTAAQADVNTAVAEYNQVVADVAAGYAQVVAQNTSFAAQQVQYNATKAMYEAQLSGARTTASQQCSQAAFTRAVEAGLSGTAEDNDLRVFASGDLNGWNFRQSFSDSDSKSWSPAQLYAQAAQCEAAQNALQLATKNADLQRVAMNTLISALVVQMAALNIQQNSALQAREAAAWARTEAAYPKWYAAIRAVASQEGSAAQSVQSLMGQLIASIAAIDNAYVQSDLAAAKIALEQQQVNYDIRTRFGVRARFRSYDLWRARAITENARRLALAARRAIESRYVVDLSAMSAPEPFVDSPSVWADTVFASDLKPISIGLTPSPVSGTGINTNAVTDYVNNLSLFLDGFPVRRPSATVASDAEVIQIAAPAAQVVSSSYGAPYSYIDPMSSGWSFYCDNTGAWISNPDIVKFMTTTPVWTLSTACAGLPPSQARLLFWLDPWGRPQGSVANAPYTSRYNVRVGGVALNLVGSGIRSCQKAPDPAACYAEPFIRYDLKQVGPAWVTSYDQEWRSLDIARAVVESGKALASEEWLDPISNGFNRPDVINVARPEFQGRPIGGAWELTLRLTPDVNVERISRIQLLAQTAYWVREQQ